MSPPPMLPLLHCEWCENSPAANQRHLRFPIGPAMVDVHLRHTLGVGFLNVAVSLELLMTEAVSGRAHTRTPLPCHEAACYSMTKGSPAAGRSCWLLGGPPA